MADALVSVVVEQLASFLLEHHKEEVGLVAGACGEIKKLATTFEKIHAILYDAENQQVKNKSVKIWLGELKDVAYEIEDLLEEWHTRILKSQIDGDDDNAGSSSSKKKGLSQLKALETLSIVEYNSLTCIPDEELQHITSLKRLDINGCSIMGPRCEKVVGEDWSIISHIPNICIYG